MNPIYLDYNGTTPIAKEVADAMLPYLHQHFGNPSSASVYGAVAKQAVETARRQVADLLGCLPSEIVFTSGGTESNNYAIKGVALAYRERGTHIVTSAVEHPAVAEVCKWLAQQGFRVTVLPVDGTGLVDPCELEQVITSETTLVTVMHANNEVGTVQPIAELAEIAHAHGALMHTDAAQSIGKIPVNVEALGVDLLSVAGHKLYAPKGVGALFVREGVRLTLLMHGAGQESGRRPGTENVLEIVGLGEAAELGGEAVRLNGHPEKRLPNTLSLSFRDIEADGLLIEVSDRVAISAGAACHANATEISAVLKAMDVPMDWAMSTLRFSVGRGTTAEQIDETIQVVASAVRDLQS